MSSTVFERQPAPEAVVRHSLSSTLLSSFWLDDVHERPSYGSCVSNEDVDLAIVGGGYLGLWTAILAKERNPSQTVVVLEAVRVGHAASGRNGGFCEASITHGELNGNRRWPEEMEQLEALGRQNLDDFEATIARYGIDCDFERTGSLVVATERYQVAELAKHTYLSAEETQAQVRSPTFLAATWDRTGTALVHPGKLAVGLARVATELGVRIYEGSKVTRLQASGTRISLATAEGAVAARKVVLATNAYPSLLKRHRWHTIPVYDYVLMTEPLSDAQLASIGWSNRQGLSDMGNQFHYYRLTRDNRILFGGYDAVYHFGGKLKSEFEDRNQSYVKLAHHFFTTFPQLEGLKFSHRWAGVIDTSTQFCAFFADAMKGRVHYAAGFTGLGVAATRFAANVLLDKCDGLDTERTRLRMVREMPIPFPPEPIRSLVVKLTQWSLDRADRNGGKRNLYLRTLDALGLGFDS